LQNLVSNATALFDGPRCQACVNPTNPCPLPLPQRLPVTCSGLPQLRPPASDPLTCCEAYRMRRDTRITNEIQRTQQSIAAVANAPLPPAPAQIFRASVQNTCVATLQACLNTDDFPALINDIDKQQRFCEVSGQKYCKLTGEGVCIPKSAPCVPLAACPSDKPVRCPIFGNSDGSVPCVAIGAACPSNGLQKQCAIGTFPCPSGLNCAPGPSGTREFFKQCMGDGNETKTSTWNGCPPATVPCTGRPFICVPLNGTRTQQQLCDARPGAFSCPVNQKFCGYRRDANGKLVGGSSGNLISICLPSGSSLSCPSPDVKPLPHNFTFGTPISIPAVQSIEGTAPDGSARRLVAKFGVNRGSLASSVPAFFTGDGSTTSQSVSFSVRPCCCFCCCCCC
jgi:hypothetical protein